ncbi:glycosyltransferase family 2 protein [Sphingomonas sp. KR1UV-12]|uniref:Glycosyltransferase family 2 protein n=1 Tax=Sphingomonas aurea TaxID=3063994 RepID=A0ABT9EF40_9SPHN|nr:glycosyltransferase family 2 protein [Sphingomonas sp. KR1UV-12]MDP1025589.1 glycosyltransferase family 2 protein [Sphingomonas sp. KR1UV-12]
MTVADLFCLLIASPLLLVTGVFVVEVWAGIVPRRGRGASLPAIDPARTVILVPAHDEAVGISAVIAAMRTGMPAGMRILVVADNCTDDTAAIARAAGAEVIERLDAVRRGKGFALDHGRQALAAAPPSCVIVVDADTVPQVGALERLAALALSSGRPVQSAYTIAVRDGDGSVARFSAAAFYVKNAVRQLGAARIGAPSVLTGSGMAFPWAIFAGLPLATGHVAEDLMLGVESSLDGHAPLFEPHAAVLGTASSDKGTAVQRRRWESGFFQVASDSATTLLGRAVRGRLALGWLGLHLLTPPLIAMLALDGAMLLVLALVWLVTGGGGVALAGLGSMTLMAVAGVALALTAHRQLALLGGWRDIPRYVLWKLGVSLAAMVRREKSWIRTDRD